MIEIHWVDFLSGVAFGYWALPYIIKIIVDLWK